MKSLIYGMLRSSWLSCSVRKSCAWQSASLVGTLTIMMTLPVSAQWQIIADGQPWQWRSDGSADSMLTQDQKAIRMFHQQGYLYAVIDSQNVAMQTLFVSLGPRAQLGKIRILGGIEMDSRMHPFPLQTGDWITSRSLENVAETILDYHVEEGYALAEVAVEAVVPRDQVHHDIIIRVWKGVAVQLEGVSLQGARRTQSRYVHHHVGLTPGQSAKNLNLEEIQRKLEATGMFSTVGLPSLYKASDSTVVIHVPVKESSPGVFDVALGYERAETGKAALVGSGKLALRNLFGGGRTLELSLNRAPGQVGMVHVQAETPLIFGLPMSLAGSFEGLQQDSTYGKRNYAVRFGYWIAPSIQIFASMSREVTRPGLAGTELIQGRQRIPIANARFFGGGIQIREVDHRLSPTRGYVLNMHAQRGNKDTERNSSAPDSIREQRQLDQSRLMIQGRIYVPVRKRALLVTGGELMLVRSWQLDESDLFRIGGAQSLRGYDEDRFRASFAVRILAEVRYLLDRTTYGFGFFDLGHISRSEGFQLPYGWYPGFGVGFQLNTAAGLINFTLASTTENISAVRAHIGLSLGL